MQDTFYTLTHKGIYIHACYDHSLNREKFKINSPINGYSMMFYSLRSAKLACSRIVKCISKGFTVEYPHHMKGE